MQYVSGVLLKMLVTRPGVNRVKPKVWFKYLIMMQQVRLMMFPLNIVNYSNRKEKA